MLGGLRDFGLFVGVLFISQISATELAGQPPRSVCEVSCFQELRDSVLATVSTEAERDTLRFLFEKIESERGMLSGRSIWDRGERAELLDTYRRELAAVGGSAIGLIDLLRNKPLVDMLRELAERTSIRVVAALLCDTTDDDYVRQAALRVCAMFSDLNEHDVWSLSRIYLCSLGAQKMLPSGHEWIDHDQFRYAIGARALRALSLPDSLLWGTTETGVLLLYQPRQWLIAVLEQALLLETNVSRYDQIAQSLQHAIDDRVWRERERTTKVYHLPLRSFDPGSLQMDDLRSRPEFERP